MHHGTSSTATLLSRPDRLLETHVIESLRAKFAATLTGSLYLSLAQNDDIPAAALSMLNPSPFHPAAHLMIYEMKERDMC